MASDRLSLPTRQFDVRETIVVKQLFTMAETINVWWSVPSDSPFQRVLDFETHGTYPVLPYHEPENGNKYLFMSLKGPVPAEIRFDARYRIEREPGSLAYVEAQRQAPDAGAFGRYLGGQRYISVNTRTTETARRVAGTGGAIERAQRILDHVSREVPDESRESFDVHSAFVSYCRSAGIPARLVFGQALENGSPGEALEIAGASYHCWAECFAAGAGWFGVDAACSTRRHRNHPFGEVDTDHVAWSLGSDIALFPAQNGARLLHFSFPYVEVDGRAHPHVTRRLVCRETEPRLPALHAA